MSLRSVIVAFSLVATASACGESFWMGTERQITLRAFGYWGGTFEWSRTGEQLTDEQRAALSKIRLVEGNAQCPQDIQTYVLETIDAAGTERTASANALDANCTGSARVIEFAALEPLLSTLGCIATGEAGDDIGSALPIRADDGCRHGFFAYAEQPAAWVRLSPASEGGPHTIVLAQCEGKSTALELRTTDGLVLAESSGTGAKGAPCAKITHALQGDGSYLLKVTAEAVSVGGHVLLDFTSG